MENAEQILVVFLSVTLATFLLLAIIATIKTIQILNHLKAFQQKQKKLPIPRRRLGSFSNTLPGLLQLVNSFQA